MTHPINTTNIKFYHVETALCLWEAALLAFQNEETVPAWLEEYHQKEGAFATRHLMIYLAPKVDELWESLDKDDPSAIAGAFDWEFCPAVLDLMTNHYTLPTTADMLAHFNFIAGE